MYLKEINIKKIDTVYFIGIGGIGMSALARYFKYAGKKVLGYDRIKTDLTRQLQKEGIPITYEDSLKTLPAYLNLNDSLIVYTPAIPKNHVQTNELIKRGFPLYKRSEILGMITQNTTCIAVSGTHGKTSTASLLGHILYENNIKSTAFFGGICENYQSNLILGGNEYSVVEADEFDRSFLKLSPDIIIITSMDADHLDIYGAHDELEKSFQEFVGKLSETGRLITRKKLPIQGTTYAIDGKADMAAQNIRIKNGIFIFDVLHEGSTHYDFELSLPGKHNIENALAAITVARILGLSFEEIRASIKTFRGIKRRFSIHYNKKRVYIDDYAHHPAELDAVINTVKELFIEKKLLVVFQPHLYSRTRDFAEAFAKSLSQADELIIMDIYPARELPIEGITSKWLLSKISLANKQLANRTSVLDKIKASDFEVLLTAGAGNIDTLVTPIKKWLNEK